MQKCFRLRSTFIDVKLDINDDVFVYIIAKDANKSAQTLYNFEEPSYMMIYEVYKKQEGGLPVFKEYAAWFEEIGTLEHIDLDKYMRRQNLQGVNFMVTAKHSMPHIGILADESGRAILEEGIFVDLFLELQKVLNFR